MVAVSRRKNEERSELSEAGWLAQLLYRALNWILDVREGAYCPHKKVSPPDKKWGF